jgi:hypothetical protein
MSLPSVTLKAGEMACCPDCKQPQSDLIEDYLAMTRSTTTDHCESCHIGLRIVRLASGDFEVQARHTRAEILELRRPLG